MERRTYGNCEIVEATSEHIDALKDNLRHHDALECLLLGSDPESAMKHAFETDTATYTALDSEGKAFGMFGSGPLVGTTTGYIWFLGTPEVNKHRRAFLRASRDWVQFLSAPYDATANIVLKDNKVAVRWLKFCGAKFIREIEVSGQSFYEFIITPN